jgi:hypothetical protein
MKNMILAVSAVSAVAASANAGFQGFVASVRTSGAYTIIDIFAGVSNASDKFLNVYDANISTTVAGGFFQQAGLANKTWKPDTGGFSNTRNSIDSFMTAGIYSGGAYGDEYYPSTNTTGDPNFTGTSWSATPASAAATTIPANAGWYTGDPTSVDNSAQFLAPLAVGYTRFDTGATDASGNTAGSVGSANATYGIWCAHLVIAGILNPNLMSSNITWSGSVVMRDLPTESISTFAPAPGAIALIAVASFLPRHRRP